MKCQTNVSNSETAQEFAFRTRLKALRQSKDLTQEQLARKLSIDRSTYFYYETGKTQPNIKYLIKLSTIFDVSVDELVGNHPQTKTYPLQK